MTRQQFERFWLTREPWRVVMEGCSSSHFWARLLIGLGFEVKLIPPHYVGPYRRPNKTDAVDCEAILEADRCAHRTSEWACVDAGLPKTKRFQRDLA